MAKAVDAFRTISEVADDLGIPKHVLRFWEVKFAQIRPMKRGGGRRYYRPEDMELLKGIQHLLHRDGYTIKGVQKILREQGIEAVKIHAGGAASSPGHSGPSIPPVTTNTVGGSSSTGPGGAGAGRAGARGSSVGNSGASAGRRSDAGDSSRLLPAVQRASNEQRKPAPSTLNDTGQERLISAAIVELRACRALLRGEPLVAADVGRRSRASGSR